MTASTILHTLLALAALPLGAALLLRPKATHAHRFLGWAFAGIMLGVALTGVAIAVELGRWSVFLVFSAVTLVGVPAGLLAVWRVVRHGRRDQLEGHYYAMAWTYAGLVLALVAQSFLTASKFALLDMDGTGGLVWIGVFVAGNALAWFLIERAKPAVLARYGAARTPRTTAAA